MERKRIVFATNNAHKLSEIKQIVGERFDVLSLSDAGCHEDIPETADTIAGNARMKAMYVSEKYGVDCFADDTGLEVSALDGAPGVHTARYASEQGKSAADHDTEANMRVLLENLEGKSDRKARFVTCIAYKRVGEECVTVEGICEGRIAEKPSGKNGFGYDPVFIPDEGGGLTFAELSPELKNRISHRGKATVEFMSLLDRLT